MILQDKLRAYRARTFNSNPELRLKSIDLAVDFVNMRGYVFFWPIAGITLPSLWVAAAGDRPVPNEHDDPGHITWGWKDDLLGKKRIYYGRVLRKKNTMVSMETAPYFYALTPNFGAPEEDYLIQYEMGQLTLETKQLFETLLKEGPLDTLSLRRAAHLSGPGSDARFNHALDCLQVDMRILPVGVSRAGAWHYAFIYDTVHHHLPEILENSRLISEKKARSHLIRLYFDAVGAAQMRDLTKLFGWSTTDIQNSLDDLSQKGEIHSDLQLENEKGEWFALSELV